MDERAALLKAICENPDDDTPRLVFADWLQENGEEARAEFIRLQVRHAERLRHAAPNTEKFARRARELWLEHGVQWRADLPAANWLKWHDAFFRGFVERVTVASDTELVRHAEVVFGQPIRQLVITNFEGANGFAELAGLARLRVLTLVNRRVTVKAVAELLRCNSFSETMMLLCFFGPNESEKELRKAFGARLHLLDVDSVSVPR